MNRNYKAVVLCGGEGLRLWPLSRAKSPKHLISLTDGETFLQETLTRLEETYPIQNIYIVTNVEHKYEIVGQLYAKYKDKMPEIICEPYPKNTLPAITYAVNHIHSHNKDSVITVYPADHSIKNDKTYKKAIDDIHTLAELNHIVTVGIKPLYPNINFGYIHKSSKIDISEDIEAFNVRKFVEKPDEKNAVSFFKKGYLWNSGIYGFKSEVFLELLKKYQKKIYDLLVCDENYDIKEIYDNLDPLSIDVGLAEKIDSLVVLESNIIWQDLGEWNSILESFKSSSGNALKGDLFCDDVENSLVWNYSSYSLISGVKDLIIVNTQDSLLIIHKDKVHRLKDLLSEIRQTKPQIIEESNTTHRPWGYFIVIKESADYKIKKIFVRPEQKLSLQTHQYRSEHWVVISGEATVINGDKKLILKTNESTYIPRGTKHRLENNCSKDLEIIEIQSGSYLGEDDIVRISDIYDRK